jgi:hypothetical protein
MLEQFRPKKFRADALAKIKRMVEIVDEYSEQGLRLTARQLYYQFVSRDIIPNTPAEYKRLTSLLADARYAGLVDWSAIEDRGRVPTRASEWRSIKEVVNSAIWAFRLPRWETQPNYAELWVEKQALAGVLEPLADEFHVTLMVNKGYSSASAMYEAARRIRERGGFRTTTILYLGDHDPSGEDMVRDIEARLREFRCESLGSRLVVKKVALTMDQVEQYNPPPNPAKLTDSRSTAYIAKHGHSSWEVDALPPNVLAKLIREEFSHIVDTEAMEKIMEEEEVAKARLKAAMATAKL